MNPRRFALLVALAPLLLAGCLNEAAESPWRPPGVVTYIKTVDVNRYLALDGTDTGGNVVGGRSEFDLHFYSVGSTECFGVRSGFFPDQYGYEIVLRYMDLGPVKFELVDRVPENGTREADYRPIARFRGWSDNDTAEGHTLFRRDHVYALFKWNAEGGNYAKILCTAIHDPISRMQIRGAYQTRQGVASVRAEPLP